MKFLAILRDSLREAVDAKIFYVMLVLSGLLTLFAFSISFEPRPARETLEWMTQMTLSDMPKMAGPPGISNIEAAFRGWLRGPQMAQLHDVTDLDPQGGHVATRRYRLRIAGLQSPDLMGRGPTVPALTAEQVGERFGKLGNFRMAEATEVKDLGNGQFELTVVPTSAMRMAWHHEVRILFGLLPVVTRRGLPVGYELYFIESNLVIDIGGWVTVLVSVIITAFFMPNMLQKGTIDLLLAKPIHRWTLLVYKYIGGLTFIFLNTTVAIVGIWLALGVRSGIWASSLLLTIPVLTFYFAILYSVSVLFGVLTRSPVASILITCFVWFLLFVVGVTHQFLELERKIELERARAENRQPEEEHWFPRVVRGVHKVLPRTRDLSVLNDLILRRELMTANQVAGTELETVAFDWKESLGVSLAFIAVMLGLACWRFSAKDY